MNLTELIDIASIHSRNLSKVTKHVSKLCCLGLEALCCKNKTILTKKPTLTVFLAQSRVDQILLKFQRSVSHAYRKSRLFQIIAQSTTIRLCQASLSGLSTPSHALVLFSSQSACLYFESTRISMLQQVKNFVVECYFHF